MKITDFFVLNTFLCSILSAASAAEIEMNTARMQAMDKITGHVNVINVPVGGAVNFGSLSIVVRSCKSRPVEEAPENFAFVDVTDKSLKGEEINIFKGWMLSSSPATNAVEHPIYDVWLLQCLNTQIENERLLSAEQLAARDNLPMAPRPSSLNTATAELQENASTQAADETPAEKTMREMEYIPQDSQPETLVKQEDENISEFSFDEDDDIGEIQNELRQIRDELQKNI